MSFVGCVMCHSVLHVNFLPTQEKEMQFAAWSLFVAVLFSNGSLGNFPPSQFSSESECEAARSVVSLTMIESFPLIGDRAFRSSVPIAYGA